MCERTRYSARFRGGDRKERDPRTEKRPGSSSAPVSWPAVGPMGLALRARLPSALFRPARSRWAPHERHPANGSHGGARIVNGTPGPGKDARLRETIRQGKCRRVLSFLECRSIKIRDNVVRKNGSCSEKTNRSISLSRAHRSIGR